MSNRKVRAHYDNGWHTGTIQWYNSRLDEYRILFPDGTDDYVKYTKSDLDAAVKAINNGLSYGEVCKRYNIAKSTLHDKVNKKNSGKVGCPNALTCDIEAKLVELIGILARWRCPINKLELRIVVKDFLMKRNIIIKVFKDNTPGEKWLNSFLKRHNLKLMFSDSLKRGKTSVSETELTKYYENIHEALNGVAPHNIYNYSETSISDDPKGVLAPRKCFEKLFEKKQEQARQSFSVMFCGNAVGDYMPPMVVYKSKNIYEHWQQDGPENTIYRTSKNGWFGKETFEQWFFEIFVKSIQGIDAPIALIGNNRGSHFSESVIDYCMKNSIRFVTVPSSSKHLRQPLDVVVFEEMKNNWMKILKEWKLLHPLDLINRTEFSGLLKELCSAMTGKNLISGFKVSGIYPLNKEQVLKQLVTDMERKVDNEVGPCIREYLCDAVDGIKTASPPRKKKCFAAASNMEKISIFSDKTWKCCRCRISHAKRGEKLKWIVCDECDRVFHLKCSGVVYGQESIVNIGDIDFKCNLC